MKTVGIVLAVLGALALGMPLALSRGGAPEAWKAPSSAAKKKNPVAADAPSLAAGKRIYVKECRPCHGTAGKGDGPKAKDLARPPGNLADPRMGDQSDGALFWKITTGKKPMPSFEQKLSDADRWSTVNYVRTLAPKKRTGSP